MTAATWPRRYRRPRQPRWTPLVVVAAAVSVLVAGCGDPPRTPIEIRIATGSPTAVYYAFGQSLATILNRELPGVTASVLVTAASAENVELVSSGEAELGFTQADVLSAGTADGTGLIAVARVYDDLLHLVTRADGPIHRLADLRGRRVSIGAPGSGTEITASRLLHVARARRRELRRDPARHRRLGGGAAGRRRSTPSSSPAGCRSRRSPSSPPTPPPASSTSASGPSRCAGPTGEVYVARDIPRSVYGHRPDDHGGRPELPGRPGRPAGARWSDEVTRLLMERRDGTRPPRTRRPAG